MADIVTVTQLHDGPRYCEYEFTNESDGTGESAVKKIDLTNLVGSNGALTGGDPVTSLTFIDGDWEVIGFNYVTVLWDRQAEDKLCLLATNTGKVDYFSTGGKPDPARDLDGTGNILLTIDGATDGDSYRIRMRFRKKY
jgi:hypothetical protein